jgi:hypothetical protein
VLLIQREINAKQAKNCVWVLGVVVLLLQFLTGPKDRVIILKTKGDYKKHALSGKAHNGVVRNEPEIFPG